MLTIGGRLTQLALGFFIVLMMAVYTSSLTSELLVRELGGTVSSFEEAMERRYHFCAQRTSMAPVVEVYPNAQWARDPRDGEVGIISRADVLHYIDHGLCDAAVLDEEDLDGMHANGRHCNITIVGRPIAFESIGLPLSRRLEAPLRLHMQVSASEVRVTLVPRTRLCVSTIQPSDSLLVLCAPTGSPQCRRAPECASTIWSPLAVFCYSPR